MFINYGDRNFFERGVLVDSEHSDETIEMLLCRPYCDSEDNFMFGHVYVSINDDWIDRKAVMDFIGMTEESFDPIQFAIGCTDYYSWDNFGAELPFADWRNVDRDFINQTLNCYLIASDNLDMSWK